MLGVAYRGGRDEIDVGLDKDPTLAARWLRKAARQGHAKAQSALARLYFTGNGVGRDIVKSAEWARQAAEQGEAQAQHILAMICFSEEGGARDDAEGERWLTAAAEQGLVRSRELLDGWRSGKIMFAPLKKGTDMLGLESGRKGEGAQKPPTEPEAMAAVGRAYRHGEGVAQDHVEAVKWLRKAAAQGHAGAQFELGCAYATAEGVERDVAEAVEWHRRAAEQGHVKAQFSLGGAYYFGEGVEQNRARGIGWDLARPRRSEVRRRRRSGPRQGGVRRVPRRRDVRSLRRRPG